MPVTVFASGTQTATIGTEHFLTEVDQQGVYTFHVDRINMATGDILELRIYQRVLSGGTPRTAYFTAYYGAAPTNDMIAISVPISNDLNELQALRFSLRQTHGTGRSYPWKVLRHS